MLKARLATILVPGRRGIAALAGGREALVEPLPTGLTEGSAVHVEIRREAVPEKGRPKLPKAKVTEAPEKAGPSLFERIAASGLSFSRLSHFEEDRLEAAGWSALIEEAQSGEIGFEGGSLRMSLTPAMTLFDVDGALSPRQLAIAGAAAAGRAIRRLGIAGSIGIDLPTLPSREDRQAAAAAFDAALPLPFERTAVNGFGFLQIVRKRSRASLPELVQGDPVGTAARLLLRRAERSPGSGERSMRAAPPVIARMEQNPEWLEMLEKRIGARALLHAEPGLAISGGHVQSAFH